MPTILSSANYKNVMVSNLRKKAFRLMKESTLISILFATLLYFLMRVFFIGADFSIVEGFELFGKTCFITWCYISLWNLVCLGIIWVDVKTTQTRKAGVFNIRVFKRAAIFILLVAITYSVKANQESKQKCIMKKTKVVEADSGFIPKFYIPVKF